MLDTTLLSSIAQQMMSGGSVMSTERPSPSVARVNITSGRWLSRWTGANIRPSNRTLRSRAAGGNLRERASGGPVQGLGNQQIRGGCG